MPDLPTLFVPGESLASPPPGSCRQHVYELCSTKCTTVS